jgi:hypothetical protein
MEEERRNPDLYLIVEFNWPENFTREDTEKARILHERLQGQEWIEEALAASGGIGYGGSSMWIFRLRNYAGLDRLLMMTDDPVSKAYIAFFTRMADVTEKVRQQVIFL